LLRLARLERPLVIRDERNPRVGPILRVVIWGCSFIDESDPLTSVIDNLRAFALRPNHIDSLLQSDRVVTVKGHRIRLRRRHLVASMVSMRNRNHEIADPAWSAVLCKARVSAGAKLE